MDVERCDRCQRIMPIGDGSCDGQGRFRPTRIYDHYHPGQLVCGRCLEVEAAEVLRQSDRKDG